MTYCKDYESAISLRDKLADQGWKTINYTPGTITTFHYESYSSPEADCAHSVIGQEFDNIAVILDSKFKYNDSGVLTADNTYYSQSQMLYQIVTRTRKRLHVIVINNAPILNRIVDIMGRP